MAIFLLYWITKFYYYEKLPSIIFIFIVFNGIKLNAQDCNRTVNGVKFSITYTEQNSVLNINLGYDATETTKEDTGWFPLSYDATARMVNGKTDTTNIWLMQLNGDINECISKKQSFSKKS
ncbi:MAG: hypothetical protein IPL21_09035 [Saprospirales bacterium]|nr:hypothetical protein [Saprospirales bacterium]